MRAPYILVDKLGEHLTEKKRFLSGIAQITSLPPTPHITKPSNNDYDNVGSDNSDYKFGTFDNVCVKKDQQVSHNMILMSRYMG